MELYLLIGLIFAFSLLIGILLEKIRIPWLFAPLFLGLIANILSIHPENISNFTFVADIGMYFMLFVIGFKLDLEEFKKLSKKIFRATILINTTCSIIGMLLVMSFGYPPLISLIAGIAMATVGEEILVPILDEFGMIKSKLGTMMIGIGVFDDIFEVTAIILAGTLVASSTSVVNPEYLLIGIGIPILLTLGFMYVKGFRALTRKYKNMEDLILIGLSIMFVYMAIGGLAGAEGMGAILAGIALKNLVPNKQLKRTEFAFDVLSYGFFGPLFFTWVGMSVNITSIYLYPLLTIAFYLVAMASKILTSWFVTKRDLGSSNALILGIGLSVRFSTELVIAQLLYSSNVINASLFTAIVVSSALATLINPLIMVGVMQKVKNRKRITLVSRV